MKQRICGIYQIRNKVNDKCYIGQSVDCVVRFYNHKVNLRKNQHDNQHLQNAWNKYGEAAFEFIVLQECLEDELNTLEHNFISESIHCYNISKDIVGGRLSKETRMKMSLSHTGDKNAFYGKKHSEDSKSKMSEWKKINYLGCNNPNYGKSRSSDVIMKMILNHSKTKLDETKVLSIVSRLKTGCVHEEIAKEFGVSRTVVTRISNGDRWSIVTGIVKGEKNGSRI